VNQPDDGLLISFRQCRNHLESLPHPSRFAVVIDALDLRRFDAEQFIGRNP